MVALVIEGADLDLGGEDDASIRVENRGSFTAKRSVGERRNVKVRVNWRNGGNEWDYALAHFNLHSWPHVPTHPNSIDSLWIYVPFLTCFFFFFKFSFNYENYYKKGQNGVVLIT